MFSDETLHVIFQTSDESSSSETKEPLILEVDIPEDFDRAIQNVWANLDKNKTIKEFYLDVVETFRKNKYIYRDKSYPIINNYNTHYLKKIWMFLYKKYGKDDNTNNYNKVDDIIKDITEKDLKIKDVNQPWPYGKVRRQINQRDAQKAQRVADHVKKISPDDFNLLQDYLGSQNPELKNITKKSIIEMYKQKGVNDLKGDLAELRKQRDIRDEYNKKIKSYKEVIQKYTLPKLKLDNGWSVVELENLKKTNITYPIKVLKKNESNSVFFGEKNFIIKYQTKNDEEMLKGSQTRKNLQIIDDVITLDEKNILIPNFEEKINELNEQELYYLQLNNYGELATAQIEIKNKNPYFLKNDKSLNNEQAFVVQQPAQNWLIFHDPGVGKTLNALAVAIQNLNEQTGNIHVVAPSKSILQQWQETLTKFIDLNKTNITLTTQTQAMFIKVCNEGSKGSFYDYFDENDPGGIVDDFTLKKLDVVKRNFEFGPNMTKLLEQLREKLSLAVADLVNDVFEELFINTNFLQDFLRSFWAYCFVFDDGNSIWVFANIVLNVNETLAKTLTTDMFRPIIQFDLQDKKKDVDQDEDEDEDNNISKTESFQKFFDVATEKLNINNINLAEFLNTPTEVYVDYGKIKIKIINKNIKKINWNEVPKEDPIEHFPMLGKNTILIIDESHNVVSNNLEKKSVRFVSDVGRHCKHIICCSATPFNSAKDIEYQMYAYGRILNDDPIHYFNVNSKSEIILLEGLDLVRNKVTGKKKVTSQDDQKQKITNVLKRLTRGELKNTLQKNQDLLFRRLNYDFFELFKPLTNFYASGMDNTDNKVAGFKKDDQEYIHLSSELERYSVDKNIDFAKRRILYRQLQYIFNIKPDAEDKKIYPTVDEKIIMFAFKTKTSKRFSKINLLNRNDYMVGYKSKSKKTTSATIDKKWRNKNNFNDKIYYCYEGKGNTKDDNEDENNTEDTNDVLTVFTNKGSINSKIFVPDLIVSKIKFMVEEALENIILNHKNVMIYSYLRAQNKYNKEVFKMYNVKEITIVTGKKTTKDNVIATLEKAEIIKDNTLIQSVGFKLQLKWTSKDWNTLIEENGEKTFANRDKSELEKKLDLLETTGINIALSEELGGYNDVVENINNTEDDVLEAKKKKSKIWKQRILGEGALPYYIAKPIDGDVTSVEERKVIEELFSIGILDICLISDAGAQGTDFKSTRESMMYVASTDGRAVPANIMQFKGRLNRKYSHAICPPDKRTVTYTRICLYKSVRANDNQCQRMSHFFYYKVPKKGFAIDFLYTQDFANTKEDKFPKKCPFCNLLKETGDKKCECTVNLVENKTYYYLKPYEKENEKENEKEYTQEYDEETGEAQVIKDTNFIYCKEFHHYDLFLKRLLNLEFVTLLLKTESIEHNYYAQKILDGPNTTDPNDMRFMAIKEKDYWYFKRICYKGKLSKTINNNPKSPIKRPKPKKPERRSGRDRPKKRFDSEYKSSDSGSESKSDEIGGIGGKRSTRRKGRDPRNRGKDRGSTTTNVKLTYPENNMIVEVEWLEDENTQEKKWYVGQYLIENGVENVFYFGSTYPWKPDEQRWRFYNPGVKVGEFFRFLWSKYTGIYELIEIREDENGDPNIYYFDSPKRKGIDFNVTINAIEKVDPPAKDQEDDGEDYEQPTGGNNDDENNDKDWEVSVVVYDDEEGDGDVDEEDGQFDEEELINDPVDSIVASYPYLSLE